MSYKKISKCKNVVIATVFVLLVAMALACGLPGMTTTSNAATTKAISLKKSLTMNVGISTKLTLKNNDYYTAIWKTSNKKVVIITYSNDNSANILAVGTGTAKITVKVNKKTYTCKITVKKQKYTYKITPMLAPFARYFYVETDDPDVSDIRFVDKTSVYYTSSDQVGYIVPTTKRYADVKYVNKETGRVKGGYIFVLSGDCIDGGALTLQVKSMSGVYWNGDYSKEYQYDDYYDTKITVNCAKVKDLYDYLIDTYTSPSKTFFENMDSVRAGLGEIALYPRSTYDVTKPNIITPYPFLAASRYYELSLNEHYSMYDTLEGGLLLNNLYPCVLDSLQFPSVMATIAEKLEPSCTCESTSVHYKIKVTYNGESRYYGGAGTGTTNPLYSNRVQTLFLFDGSKADYATKTTLEKLKTKYIEYNKYAVEDAEKYRDLIAGTTFKKTIKTGSWIKVVKEWEWDISLGYAYVTQGDKFTDKLDDKYMGSVENVWVDGRYVGKNNIYIAGTTFEDYPTADIMIQNLTYTNRNGETCTGDVTFSYDSDSDSWLAKTAYNYGYWDIDSDEYYSEEYTLPDELVLTRADVEALDVDRNTNVEPTEGYVYDGSVKPGTPFSDLNKLSNAIAILEYTSCTYNGKNKEPQIITIIDYSELKKDVDYTVAYANNKSVGKATVTITGIGKYSGTINKTFNITKGTNKITDVKTTYSKTASSKKQTFALKAKATSGKVTYKSNSKSVVVKSNGSVTIKKNFIGTAKITIKAGNSNYKSVEKVVTINVNPAKVKLKRVAVTKNRAKITWVAASNVTGYELQYSITSGFTKKTTKTITIKNKKKSNRTISGLSQKKKYYVRIRAYKKKGSKIYYSSWSKVQKINPK
jgi:hypothetical protein